MSQSLWYKDAVIYQLHVRSFFDSVGDGMGDFTGLMQKLDYLQATVEYALNHSALGKEFEKYLLDLAASRRGG